jgi:hypothetical protein
MHNIYPLMMAPDVLLRVETQKAYDLSSIIACARDALAFVQVPVSLPSTAPATSYVISCLLCEVAEPHYPVQDGLSAMQEHVMASHGLTREDLHRSVRINEEPYNGCYVWGLAPARAAALGLQSLCYMRADKLKTQEESTGSKPVLTLTFAPAQALPVLEHVEIVRSDDLAWYGYPRGETIGCKEDQITIYPKEVWSARLPPGEKRR